MNYNIANYLLEENLIIANEYLTESLGVVYHATSFKNMKSILKNDEIELTPNASKFEIQTGEHGVYFLSTMRNKSGNFFQTNARQCYMVLDVDKLKTKMKSKSVNFFGPGRERSEEEERFWSDKEAIVNIEDVIKSIQIFVSTEKSHDMFLEKTIKEINFLASEKKIPVFIYNKYDNFRLGKNPIKMDDVEYVPDSTSHKDIEKRNKEILSVIHLMNGERMTKEQKEVLELLVHRAYTNDFIRTVTSDAQHLRKHDKPELKNISINFMNLMKRFKYKNAESFLREIVTEKAKKVLGKHG